MEPLGSSAAVLHSLGNAKYRARSINYLGSRQPQESLLPLSTAQDPRSPATFPLEQLILLKNNSQKRRLDINDFSFLIQQHEPPWGQKVRGLKFWKNETQINLSMTWFQHRSPRAFVRMRKKEAHKIASIRPGINQVFVIITYLCPPLPMFLNLVITRNKLSESFRQVVEKLKFFLVSVLTK